ncbi:MAG: D-alanyl-D-alanine carboxypeptidase family protein [Firmicutes bacterium]|nr:D-alanyl-D-alanine carboxypeptidase family protein [Bacillota bacterium]
MAFKNRRFEKRSRRWKRRSRERSYSNIFTRPSIARRAGTGVLYGLLALAALFLFLFIFFNVIGGGSKVKLVKDMTAEINSHRSAASFVEEVREGTILRDQAVDTSSLGKKTCRITIVSDKGKEKEYEFQITIVDTQPPTIETDGNVVVFKGSEVNLINQAKVRDNSNTEPEIEVIGKWDISSVGTYPIKLVARDASGNKAEKDLYLEVIDGNSKEGNYAFTMANGHRAEVIDGITYIDGILIVNKSFSLPRDYAPGFTNEAYYAFYEMVDAAYEDGISLWGISDYRSWDEQNELYEYYKADDPEGVDSYSARPGYSEHQSGLAIDINTIDKGFGETAEGQWLINHCWEYGFIYRYPAGKEEITGYIAEPWHYRYVGRDFAEKLYNNGDWISLEEYFGIDSKYAN